MSERTQHTHARQMPHEYILHKHGAEYEVRLLLHSWDSAKEHHGFPADAEPVWEIRWTYVSGEGGSSE